MFGLIVTLDGNWPDKMLGPTVARGGSWLTLLVWMPGLIAALGGNWLDALVRVTCADA